MNAACRCSVSKLVICALIGLTIVLSSQTGTTIAGDANNWLQEESDTQAESTDDDPSLHAISGNLWYTTYFYTAGEAIIHGFEDDTQVRLISVDQGGTVFSGTVNANEAKQVNTGAGVFSFVANKKASILVGTPSSCAVVGYWLRDQDGSFRAQRLFSHLPSNSSHSQDCRVVVWAWEDIEVTISDLTADKLVDKVKIEAGKFHEITGESLGEINNHIIDFQANKPSMSVQVYYDEGYFVPSESGRGAGRLFYTYVGTITNNENDLNLISYYTDTKVRVEDAVSGEEIFSGTIAKGQIHTITQSGRYVKVTSEHEISVLVAPCKHYSGIYAEHHFGVGGEGTGIDREFLLTTTRELWVFSYYPMNNVQVYNALTNELVWQGVLENGQVQGVHPGQGFFRVESAKGVSVMGGAASCGAEFSPATSLFAIDEALFKVVQIIREERQRNAAAMGQSLTEAQLNAPLTDDETKRANEYVRRETGDADYSESEFGARLREIQKNQMQNQQQNQKKQDGDKGQENDVEEESDGDE